MSNKQILSSLILFALYLQTCISQFEPGPQAPNNNDILRLGKSGGCWSNSFIRASSPINACDEGHIKSGFLCYPPCADDYHGIGPICWKNNSRTKSYGRGFGKPMHCSKNQDFINLLCFNQCPDRYLTDGIRCNEKCPILFPLRCEGLCVSDPKFCSYASIRLAIRYLALLKGAGRSSSSLTKSVANPSDPDHRKAENALNTIASIGELFATSGNMAMEILDLPPCKLYALNSTLTANSTFM